MDEKKQSIAKGFEQMLFEKHPVRFNEKQKASFLSDVRRELYRMGWNQTDIRTLTHKGVISSRNLVIGSPEAEYIITAHYDTPGRNGFFLRSSSVIGQAGANVIIYMLLIVFLLLMLFLMRLANRADAAGYVYALIIAGIYLAFMLVNLIPMLIANKTNRNDNSSGVLGVLLCAQAAVNNDELRKKCCFVLFDNEEWGLIGSAQYSKWLKKQDIDMRERLLINLDCIGIGDELTAVYTGKASESTARFLGRMRGDGMRIGEKRSIFVFMSDHANFPNALMLCTMKKSACGALYIPNIHSCRDIECDVNKVFMLSKEIIRSAELMSRENM